VNSSSGVPGSSSSITIRGVSSISGSNQPLFIIDGVPMDNKTQNTAVLASDAPGSTTAFNNRGVDFTNRASDFNPEDIASITVLKGAEAAALYGIDAANGAIVITTKRGQAGSAGFEYSNNFRVENVREAPEVQRVFGPTTVAGDLLGSFAYFGPAYAPGTQFYDNVDGFFRTGMQQTHNVAFSGATPDNRVNYRISSSFLRQEGVVPTSKYGRVNATGSSSGQVTNWLRGDLSMIYSNADNTQPYKGASSPLIGLLSWPGTDDASDWQTASGQRRRVTQLAAASEQDNPYFALYKNKSETTNNRFFANLGLVVSPVSWGNVKTNVSVDNYANQTLIVRHPESTLGLSNNGIMDEATDVTRNVNAQALFNLNSIRLNRRFSVNGFVGTQVRDDRSSVDAIAGQDFLDPNFVSINNTNPARRQGRTTLSQRRQMAVFGQAQLAFNDYLFVNLQGRNDWTSTIPRGANSFFYPSMTGSFVFSDAFPAVRRFVTGQIRAAYAQVGQDARPYADRPSLESKFTTGGGYGYGFTGPNPNLKPEFLRSVEGGANLSFLDDRLNVDVAYYRKTRTDQIVNDIRGSYGTGFILFNLNGAVTRNTGLELMVNMAPVRGPAFSWDVSANFDRSRGRTLSLPNELPESYVSDTWLFGNVRNGTAPGLSTRSLTGFYYLRNKDCQLLIDPTNGLPLRSSVFVDAKCVNASGETVLKGYDRNPNYTVGLTNTLRYRKATLTFLLDMRRGGDVFNATEHYLTARGLSMNTLDRERPRVIDGVLRDGRENGDNPTRNTIVVTPAQTPLYYTNISEELFIERDINWVRLRDVTLRYALPTRIAKNASVFVSGTDLFLLTNYSGQDPVVNGNTAAVGGSGAQGIDYGNFAMPRGINFGARFGF
jgi:TonB-linked SusC/RagA family outer membrane protein